MVIIITFNDADNVSSMLTMSAVCEHQTQQVVTLNTVGNSQFDHKCLHGLAPGYLSRSCEQQLRDVLSCVLLTNHRLLVPRTCTVTFGPRAFYTSGPTSWNALPVRFVIQQRHLDVLG